MLTEQMLEQLPQHYVDLISDVNSKYIELVGAAIKREAFTTSSYQQTRVMNMVRMGEDMTSLELLLAEQTKTAQEDISKLFDEIAESEYSTAKKFAEFRQMDYIPYAENTYLQQQIAAIKKNTLNTFSNISNSSMVGAYWKPNASTAKSYVDLSTAYTNAVDAAIQSVTSGYGDPYYAIRNSLKTIASTGILQAVYQPDTGRTYAQGIEVAMRRNVLDGMRQVAQSVQDQVGEQYGADAKECSTHVSCADDHLPIQGRVFPLTEWEKIYGKGHLSGTITDINGVTYDLPYRGIGLWNCRHYGFSYLIGVSEPTMSDKELAELNKKNSTGFTDTTGALGQAGKQYSIYDMTQELRKTESATRKLMYQQKMLKAAGDTQGYKDVTASIRKMRASYAEKVKVMEPYGIQADYARFSIAK